MKNVERLLIAYLLLKPLYLFESGGLQIADLFLMSAFVLYLFFAKFSGAVKSSLVSAVKSNALFMVFIAMTFLVNLTYFAYYGQFKFILSSLYFVFTFVAILMFAIFCRKGEFLDKMSKAFKFGLVAQVAVLATGLGSYFSPERYMGTFNDPNQFAFFILLSYLFIHSIKVLRSSNESSTIYLLITAGLIYASASTGMLLGLTVFLLSQLVYNLYHFELHYRTVKNIVYGATSVVIMLAAIFLTVSAVSTNGYKTALVDKVGTISIASRLEEKTVKAEGGADMTLWEERGYDKLYKYPQSLIFGAGEGHYDRFVLAANSNEVHATLPSILFYYGILPFLVLLRWIYVKVRNLDARLYFGLAALFAESLTLLNQRQSIFWILIVLGSVYSVNAQRKTISSKLAYPKAVKLVPRISHV